MLDGTIADYKQYLPAGSEPTGSATPTPVADEQRADH